MNKFVMFCLREYGQTKTILLNAADCFVSLCQCCGKGQQGINHKESWTAQFKALLSTCHKLFDEIYDCVDIVKVSWKAT